MVIKYSFKLLLRVQWNNITRNNLRISIIINECIYGVVKEIIGDTAPWLVALIFTFLINPVGNMLILIVCLSIHTSF